MKQSDIFSIIIIAAVGTLASYCAVNALLGDPNDLSETITTIDEISPELIRPDSELFNPNAINPTVEVMIDGCKDLDHNGIIDYAELVACDKIQEEQPQEEQGEGSLYTCEDGTLVADQSQCKQSQKPEEDEEEQESAIYCPDGKRVTNLADC